MTLQLPLSLCSCIRPQILPTTLRSITWSRMLDSAALFFPAQFLNPPLLLGTFPLFIFQHLLRAPCPGYNRCPAWKYLLDSKRDTESGDDKGFVCTVTWKHVISIIGTLPAKPQTEAWWVEKAASYIYENHFWASFFFFP